MSAPSLRSEIREQSAFKLLCDVAASDRLICVTGAGISLSLVDATSARNRLPNWSELLRRIHVRFRHELRKSDREDCLRLLRLPPFELPPSSPFAEATGQELMEAASILRAVSPKEFDRELRHLVTPAPHQTSETHLAIEALKAQGVITFNYDEAHETAAAQRHGCPYRVLLPQKEKALRKTLLNPHARFLLKAHGSIHDRKAPLVLTTENYRDLLVRSPAYRAFVQQLLTHHHLLIVGFRLSDPDFDLFTETMANQFGSPLHEHVAIFHERDRTPAHVRLRRRFGIRFLYVSSFTEIPAIIEASAVTAGPRLQKTLDRCLSRKLKARQQAHIDLRNLGPGGKACASAALKHLLRTTTDWSAESFKIAEVVYSLGVISARDNKATLMDVVERSEHADPIGRALTMLQRVLLLADLPTLRRWQVRFSLTPPAGDHADRVIKFLEYLLVYVPSKHARN